MGIEKKFWQFKGLGCLSYDLGLYHIFQQPVHAFSQDFSSYFVALDTSVSQDITWQNWITWVLKMEDAVYQHISVHDVVYLES